MQSQFMSSVAVGGAGFRRFSMISLQIITASPTYPVEEAAFGEAVELPAIVNFEGALKQAPPPLSPLIIGLSLVLANRQYA